MLVIGWQPFKTDGQLRVSGKESTICDRRIPLGVYGALMLVDYRR